LSTLKPGYVSGCKQNIKRLEDTRRYGRSTARTKRDNGGVKMKQMTVFGRMFGNGDATEQAEMFNEMAYALKYICVGTNSRHGHEMQLCYLADKLDGHACEMIKDLTEFIELRKEESKK
jgi:hypothetical protein